MKLYLSTTSPYSRLALIAALHSGKRDLQLHYVLPWENPAELIAINPYSQIPALLCDDGNILSETLIIMNYLDDRVLRGGCTCARAAYGIATINQAVRAFALNMHQPAHSIPHPHIARSREALARALGRAGTRLALLDEPSYSQDLSGTAQVAEMIKQDAHRRVTLMATHDSLLIDALATHVLRLPGGRIEEAGPQ